MDSNTSLDRFLRIAEVAERCGLGESTIWRMVAQKRFPAPKRLSPGRVAWPLSTIKQWADERENAR